MPNKTLIIIAVLALVFTLASCGSSGGGGGTVVGAVPPIHEPVQQNDRFVDDIDVKSILDNPQPVAEPPIEYDAFGLPIGSFTYINDADSAIDFEMTMDFVNGNGGFVDHTNNATAHISITDRELGKFSGSSHLSHVVSGHFDAERIYGDVTTGGLGTPYVSQHFTGEIQ